MQLPGRRTKSDVQQRTGRSANGMDYHVLGDGPKVLVSIPGGPGSDLPSGVFGRMMLRAFAPYVEEAYQVWTVTRPRDMPVGHTVEDMAADYAQFIGDELGGRVDLVLGSSFGGMIAFYLAANHPEVTRYVVAALASATLTESGADVDVRWATLRAEGHYRESGATLLELVWPSPRQAWLRRLVSPVFGLAFRNSATPPEDLVVEAAAEAAYDARGVLNRISSPVLMICGDKDQFFSRESVEQTAAGIRDCTLIWYRGQDHLRAGSNKRMPRDVLTWVATRDSLLRADGS